MVSIKIKYLFIIVFSALVLVTAVLITFELIESMSYKDKGKSIEKGPLKRSSLVIEGIEARNQANYKKALEIHFNAFEIAKTDNDTIGQIIALNNIATDLRRIASNTEASKYYYQALELASDDPQYDKIKSFIYNGLGNVFLSLNKNEIAKQYFQKSLNISERQENLLGQAINLGGLAETFNRQESTDSISYYNNKSLELNEEIKSNIGISLCKKALAELSIFLGDTIKGIHLISEAFDIVKDSKDLFHKFEIEKWLCDVLIKTNQLEKAELTTKDLLEIANKIGAFENKYEVYKLIAKLKEKQGNFKEAFHAQETASSYRDSLLEENNEINILEFEKQLEINQAVSKAKILTSKTNIIEKAKKRQKSIFILLSLGFICFTSLLYIRILNRKKINKELKKINKMKSCFFGNISHEFRTPLTLIKSPIEKWLSEDINPKLRTDLEIINRNSTRLLFLVEQLLNMSKVDAGSFKITQKVSDISVQLKGISQEFGYLAGDKQINYKIDIEDSGIAIFDPNCIEIILMNLLSNAFKYTPIGGYINITGNKINDHYRISVANSGNKMDICDLENIFERFYTSSISNNIGTGIGLALVKELAILHKAELKVVKNQVDEIEFIVKFPITAVEKNIELEKNYSYELQYNNAHYIQNGIIQKSKQNGFPTCTEVSDQTKAVLLIVEDNEDMRNYIAHSFDDSFDIILAADGVLGLNLARKHIPDIIISDVMMPLMNGIELCNAIKEDYHTNHIPVILLTALAEEEMILQGFANKADDYVTKPFSIKMLLTKALNLIEIRKSLSEKYREEIIIAPLNTLIKTGGTCFNTILKEILTKDIIDSNFGIEQFCEKTSMSRSQLYRKLKAISGMSVSEFIRVHRVKIASELLKNKDLNISDICYASGFNDASYFSKSFKEIFTISPLEYRKSYTKEKI